jgi:hypothetical protein
VRLPFPSPGSTSLSVAATRRILRGPAVRMKTALPELRGTSSPLWPSGARGRADQSAAHPLVRRGGPRLPDPPAALGGRHRRRTEAALCSPEELLPPCQCRVAPHARDQLEHLCRYLLRPPLALERLQLVHAVPVATGPSWYGWTLRALYGEGLPLRKPALTAWKKRSSCTAGSYACASGSVSATIARASCPFRASRLG